jgi:hypothetical protein
MNNADSPVRLAPEAVRRPVGSEFGSGNHRPQTMIARVPRCRNLVGVRLTSSNFRILLEVAGGAIFPRRCVYGCRRFRRVQKFRSHHSSLGRRE